MERVFTARSPDFDARDKWDGESGRCERLNTEGGIDV
jgi:hypothetical protein